MGFIGLTLTKAGRRLIASAISEENPLNITHIQLGEGVCEGTFAEMKGLAKKVMEIPVKSVKRDEGNVIVNCDFNSTEAPKGFYFREVGIIGNGVLCYYDNSGDDAEYIDPETETVVKQKRLRFTLAVSSDVTVTVKINSELYAMAEEVEENLGKKLDKTGDASDATVIFVQASERESISTGEKLSILFGKIAKWLSSLKTVAFTGKYEDLSGVPEPQTAEDIGAVKKAGDKMTGKLEAHGGISLNKSTTSSDIQYILGVDAFADGGTIRYQNASDVSVGKLGGLDADLFLTEGSNIFSGSQLGMIDNEGRKRVVMQAFGDGSGVSNYGSQLVIGAGGNTFVGSGESTLQLYNALQTETNKKINETYGKNGENMFISSDGHLYIYSNANQVANRKGLCFSNAGILSPIGTDNISFGTLDSPFYDIFATNLRLKPKGANYGGKLLFGNGEYVYLQEFSDDKLRIHAGNGIFFDSNIYFGAEYTPSGSPDSTYKSYPLTIKSSGEVAFGASGYGQPILTTLNSSEIKAQNIKAYDLESVDTARVANILYFGSSGTTERIELGNRMLRFYGYNGLDFQSFIRSDICPTNTGMYTLGKSAYRWKEIWCSTSLNTASDRNIKKNISDLSSDSRYIEFFMLLQPKSYLFKDGESGRTHVGFISQDVEEAMTKCGLSSLEFAGFCKDQKTERKETEDSTTEDIPVFDDEGNPVYIYSLRYEEFIALNTMMIQELYRKNESLESRISILEDKILNDPGN